MLGRFRLVGLATDVALCSSEEGKLGAAMNPSDTGPELKRRTGDRGMGG